MEDYHTPELLAQLRCGTTPVVLFGAGDIGKLAHYALTTLGVPITAFCDGSKLKQNRLYGGTEIWPPERMDTLPRDSVVFICCNYLSSVSNLLDGFGFDRIYHCANLLDAFDFSGANIGLDPMFIERKVALHRRECMKAAERQSDALVLKYLDVVVTEACSMKCQDCSNLMQYYTRPRHSDLGLLESSVDRIMASIDRIYEFRVLGGEPFVNPRVHQVIRKLTAYGHVDKVVVYSNATIVPRGENLECLKHEKVVLDITNYGPLSTRYDQMIATLEGNGITYLTKIPEWTDSGRIRYVERTAEELDDMFANCCVNDVLTLLNGRLYRCPFSANGTNLQAIPDNEADMVDLTGDLSGERLRAGIRRLYAKSTHLTACSYCNGRDYRTRKIQPAIQTRRPLPLIPVSPQRL
jgi:organic radical activating enzyme